MRRQRLPTIPTMTEKPKFSKRLRRAADFVRKGSVVADVGTDHAYLPITLLLEGNAVRAVASDIHKGPLLRAKQNIGAWNLTDKIDTVLTDGLLGIRPYAPTDILILGMGGELIARILQDATWTKDSTLRLILQPMTHPEAVRRFLWENGYTIEEEALIEEEKIYQILCASYTGVREEFSSLALLVGKQNLEARDPLCYALCRRFRSVFEERLRGKRSVGADTLEEENMLKELKEWEESSHDRS